MLKKNPFFILGIVGIAATAFIHIMLSMMLEENPMNMFIYYIVWGVFLIIGIGKRVKDKRQPL
jgi:hypothetical protein